MKNSFSWEKARQRKNKKYQTKCTLKLFLVVYLDKCTEENNINITKYTNFNLSQKNEHLCCSSSLTSVFHALGRFVPLDHSHRCFFLSRPSHWLSGVGLFLKVGRWLAERVRKCQFKLGGGGNEFSLIQGIAAPLGSRAHRHTVSPGGSWNSRFCVIILCVRVDTQQLFVSVVRD